MNVEDEVVKPPEGAERSEVARHPEVDARMRFAAEASANRTQILDPAMFAGFVLGREAAEAPQKEGVVAGTAAAKAKEDTPPPLREAAIHLPRVMVSPEAWREVADTRVVVSPEARREIAGAWEGGERGNEARGSGDRSRGGGSEAGPDSAGRAFEGAGTAKTLEVTYAPRRAGMPREVWVGLVSGLLGGLLGVGGGMMLGRLGASGPGANSGSSALVRPMGTSGSAGAECARAKGTVEVLSTAGNGAPASQLPPLATSQVAAGPSAAGGQVPAVRRPEAKPGSNVGVSQPHATPRGVGPKVSAPFGRSAPQTSGAPSVPLSPTATMVFPNE